MASGLKQKPARMLISLVNGGAIVDFRTKDGSTALHRAVVRNNAESLRLDFLEKNTFLVLFSFVIKHEFNQTVNNIKFSLFQKSSFSQSIY